MTSWVAQSRPAVAPFGVMWSVLEREALGCQRSVDIVNVIDLEVKLHLLWIFRWFPYVEPNSSSGLSTEQDETGSLPDDGEADVLKVPLFQVLELVPDNMKCCVLEANQ